MLRGAAALLFAATRFEILVVSYPCCYIPAIRLPSTCCPPCCPYIRPGYTFVIPAPSCRCHGLAPTNPPLAAIVAACHRYVRDGMGPTIPCPPPVQTPQSAARLLPFFLPGPAMSPLPLLPIVLGVPLPSSQLRPVAPLPLVPGRPPPIESSRQVQASCKV
jgi:hypothetical protein